MSFVEIDGHWINPAQVAWFRQTIDGSAVEVKFTYGTSTETLHVTLEEFIEQLREAL